MQGKFSRITSVPPLFKNMSWLLSVEGAAKVARFVTIISMAAFLSATDYGMVILCLAIHDIFRLLMKAGSGTQVIQCEQRKLKRFCQNAGAIQWFICLSLALTQFLLAPVFAEFYDKPEATILLQLMAVSYLFYPAVSVRVYLLHRAHRFKEFSLVNGACIISENLLIPILLWLDLGILSIAYAKIFSAVLWFCLFMRADVTYYGIGVQLPIMKFLLKTSTQLMVTELSKAAKQHADIFIAGRLLPADIFGFYTFAKTASVGLSQSFINAFQGALLPYMSQRNRQGETTSSQSVVIISALLSVTFISQALLAPFYIPLFFGDSWQVAITAASILCLSAIPNLWFDTFCSALRAKGEYFNELLLRAITLLIFILGLLLVAPSTPTGFATFATVMATAITLLTFISNKLNLYTIFSRAFYADRSKL